MPYPSSPARFFAPIALLAAVLATILVVSSATPDKESVSAPATTTAKVAPNKPKKPAHRTYTVRIGDTLSGIADKAGISLETIQTLNPDLDAVALHAGQKVKLVP